MSSHEPQRQATPTAALPLAAITTEASASHADQEGIALPSATPLKQLQDEGDIQVGQQRRRQRQPRNSACQTCAGLKMKCVPSPALEKCERCHRMQRDCLSAIPKPRKRRAHNAYSAVSPKDNQGSQGIPLADLLDHRTPTEPALTQARPAPVRAPAAQSVVKDALMARQDLSHNGSASFQSLLSYGLGLEQTSEHLLVGVDYTFVQTSITVFRRFAAHFPFLLLRADANAIYMSSYRPMTTLALCIVTAAAIPRTQKLLVQAFRLSLSSKVIVAGESNLDLLVGLLTFTAWHHHYVSTAQLYRDLCLLAGMVADLGLYRSRFQSFGPSAPDLECQRAFLGSYYLCTGLSIMALSKPSPIRWTENLYQCAQTVAQYDRELASAVGLVEVMHLVADFDEALRSESQRAEPTSPQFVDLHVGNILHRQKALAREHPHLNRTLISPAISCYLYHSILTATNTLDGSILIQCACTIKQYLDDLLACDPATLHQTVALDHANLFNILLLVLRLSSFTRSVFTAGTSGWESGALSSMLQVDTLVNTLLAHVDRANPHDDLAPRSEQNFHRFRAVCDAVRHHDKLAAANTQPSISTAAARPTGVPEHALGGFRPVNSVRSNPPAASMSDPVTAVPPLPSPEGYAWGILDQALWRSVSGHDSAS